MTWAPPQAWSMRHAVTTSGNRILAVSTAVVAVTAESGMVPTMNGSVAQVVFTTATRRGSSNDTVLVMPFPHVTVCASNLQPPSPVSLDGGPKNEVAGEE